MSPSPRVLAIHRYYWPDTPPYASILRAVVAHWHERGVRTEVFASQPSYKADVAISARPRRESVDGTPVTRLRLPRERHRVIAALNMGLFTLAAAWHVLTRRRDVVMCSTSPPVVLGAAVSVAARLRRSRFVYHCMDLHPEIGRLSGEFAHPLVHRLMMRLEISTCRRAAAIVVLSDDMRRAVIERDPLLAERIVVVNNPDLPDFDDAAADDVPARGPALRVVFTGNLGRFQGLEAVVDGVLDAATDTDVELVLMGDGSARESLLERASGHRAVRWMPHGPLRQARALMRTADVGVVTLQPEVIRYAYPSKTLTYLSEGLPVLAGVESGSELARTVRGEGLGVVVDPLGPDAVAAVVRDLAGRRDDLTAMREAARRYAAREAGLDAVLRRWDELLDAVTSKEGLSA